MRTLLHSLITTFLTVTLFSCGGPKIDGSSEAAFDESVNAMAEKLPPKERKKFKNTISALILFSGSSSRAQCLQELDGRTIDDILAIGEEKASSSRASRSNSSVSSSTSTPEKPINLDPNQFSAALADSIPSYFIIKNAKITNKSQYQDTLSVKFSLDIIAREDLYSNNNSRTSLTEALIRHDIKLPLSRKALSIPEEYNNYRHPLYKQLNVLVEEYTNDESIYIAQKKYSKGKTIKIYGKAQIKESGVRNIDFERSIPEQLKTGNSFEENVYGKGSPQYIKQLKDFINNKKKIKSQIATVIKRHQARELAVKKKDATARAKRKYRLLNLLKVGALFKGTLEASDESDRGGKFKKYKVAMKVLKNELDGDFLQVKFYNGSYKGESITYTGKIVFDDNAAEQVWLVIDKGSGTGKESNSGKAGALPYFYNSRIGDYRDTFEKIWATVNYDNGHIHFYENRSESWNDLNIRLRPTN